VVRTTVEAILRITPKIEVASSLVELVEKVWGGVALVPVLAGGFKSK
jgi:hypothetical protein